ncbi:MAG: hypothetical protein ACWA5A_12310 [Marinibacterium sp.]
MIDVNLKRAFADAEPVDQTDPTDLPAQFQDALARLAALDLSACARPGPPARPEGRDDDDAGNRG